MKKSTTLRLLMIMGIITGTQSIQADTLQPCDTVVMTRKDALEQPMKLCMGVIGPDAKKSAATHAFVERLTHCFQWSGCFKVEVRYLPETPHKKSEIQALFKDLYDCAVFITYDDRSTTVEWRLYDTALGEMMQGKKQSVIKTDTFYQGEEPFLLVYRVAQAVLSELTGEPHPFLSNIAYRQKSGKKGACNLVVTHFDGSNPRAIFTSSRILVSLQWNNDREYPLLLFSEFTPRNVRLMMTDLYGRSVVVLDADGTTAGVSCAPLSDDVVYCHSGSIWKYHYDKKQKKSCHTRIIHEQDTCASPILLANGDVIYSCKGAIKRYDAQTKECAFIINKGYCVAPAYSAAVNKLAYAKKVNGHMQLFVCDMKTNLHEQVTFDSKQTAHEDYRSDKTDVCWSPDGRYLLFTWERRDKSRIGLLNLATKAYTFITPEEMHCSYPTWSPA